MRKQFQMQRSRSVRPAPGTERRLLDLISVGPATVRDLHRMGIRTVPQLARCTPESLYAKLNRLTGKRQDPCCLDVFSAAVAQARNPSLPQEKCVWWYWSRQRKENHKGR